MNYPINYSHSENIHVLDGPSTIFPIIYELFHPESILDVGCGLGTWLKIAGESGISDCLGIDGIESAEQDFYVSKKLFKQCDLRQNWTLGRDFDLVLCLEVAEHLEPEHADALIASLTNTSDTIVFSAACPKQMGQNHVNCQWPAYWQKKFNQNGFVCSDDMRPLIWDMGFPEYWYKQNMFVAKRDNANAGIEPRLRALVHPDLYNRYVEKYKSLVEQHSLLLKGREKPAIYAGIFKRSLVQFLSKREPI